MSKAKAAHRQSMRRNLLPFLLGFIAMTGQAVILRAVQTVFYGNELSYAVILSSWLFWVCVGSLSAVWGFYHWRNFLSRFSTEVLMLLTLGVPAVLFGIRLTRPLLNIPAGQMMGVFSMVGTALMWTAPVALLSGAAFVVLYHSQTDRKHAAGETYVRESLGSAVAGVVFTLMLLHLTSLTLLTWIAAAVVLSGLIWVCRSRRKPCRVLAGLLACLIALLWCDAFVDFDKISQKGIYPQGELLAVADSPYENLAVVQTAEDQSFYRNGMLSFTIGDHLSAEENVHFAMLAHPHPHRVLLVGNGLGGEISEILKYPGIRLDFVEIDKRIIGLFQRYASQDETAVLSDPAVSVKIVDARQFIRTRAGDGYDVVLVNCGDPYTAGINRYYTLEFLKELRHILNPGGIAAFRVSSSENYLNHENKVFLSILDQTLRAVFPDVRSIPGDMHTFLVSDVPNRIHLDPELLVERLKSVNLENRFLTPNTLAFYLDSRRLRQIEAVLAQMPEGLLNTDLFPRAYLFRTVLWTTHFGPAAGRMMERIAIPFWVVLVVSLLFIFMLGSWQSSRKRASGVIDLAVAVTGFSEIIFQVTVILMFQSLYGTAYEFIALMIAAFMMGLVLGAAQANYWVSCCSKHEVLRIFLKVQGGIVVYPLVLPVLFVMFRDAGVIQPLEGIKMMLFACLPLVAGLLGGMQYPLAARLRQSSSVNRGAAGRLYALDALGAAAGALVTGLILIPLYGITAVCLLSAALNGLIYFFCLMVRYYPARSSA